MQKIDELSIFDLLDLPEEPEPKPAPEKAKEPESDQDPAEDWCLVYLVTKSGGNAGNLFVLIREDAQTLCSDECSHGMARNGQWMFQWTSLSHFRDTGDRSAADRQARDTHGKLTPFVFIRDTGKQDKDFERLGIHKPDIYQIEKILKGLGYQLTYKSSKERLIESGLASEKEFAETEKYVANYLRRRVAT